MPVYVQRGSKSIEVPPKVLAEQRKAMAEAGGGEAGAKAGDKVVAKFLGGGTQKDSGKKG